MNEIDALRFIQECVHLRRIHWTYHVNMRLERRGIPREALIDAVDTYEIVEWYPTDKYLPSCLVFLKYDHIVYHAVVALDEEMNAVRIVTTYRPNPAEWDESLRKRRIK